MLRNTLLAIAEDLKAGCTPELSPEDFPCFSAEAASEDPRTSPEALARIAASLGPEDACVFERAARAMDEGDMAWIGFKVVTDAAAAQANVDNEVTKKYGDIGSADGYDLVFFCNDAKEVVAGRPCSPRDLFQMKDVTRGPSMHNDQFEGLTWVSTQLFDSVKVWLAGASDVAVEVAALAHHVGFDVEVLDDDASYLSEARFPDAERTLLNSFDELDSHAPLQDDYVCVLTRGHMHDPESCLWAVRHGVHYVGMMGCKGKNNRVHDLCIQGGMTEEQWDGVKRPIGLKFGAKTPAELAIAIVAELVDVRYRQRYSEEARAKHEGDVW
ncbi:MAG TPA: XdhC family protein [Slackia equolifaciens]|uniref:XdhC family protein n=1 Tax=Slackia equolifaciens TaxID=498718 RepID=A0A9D2UYV2_9ACTN|nr:XdhC family protein [Slackia equolifaciens]